MDMTLLRLSRVLMTLSFVCVLLAEDASVIRTMDGGQHRKWTGITAISLAGDASTLGRQAGELIGPQTQDMLNALKLHPALALQLQGNQVQTNADIPDDYREEITAWAQAADCDPALLLRSNLAVDALCTAVVRLTDTDARRPLLIARNMDFAPAKMLGEKTVLIARRPLGRRASLSIGWPGYVGIVSGMNDAGVCACLLLNLGAKRNPAGDSLGLRLRAILDHATSLDEAARLFAATPIQSSNYVLLADAKSARVMWWSDGVVHQNDPKDGWLFCTNARINPESHLPEDDRGQHAHTLSQTQPNPDVDWMKQILTATYMPGNFLPMNAQAMVFVPEKSMIHLALYGTKEAALSAWHEVHAGDIMRGADLATVPSVTSPAIDEPFQHYTKTR